MWLTLTLALSGAFGLPRAPGPEECLLPPLPNWAASGTQHAYPAWSPDGEWIVFNASPDINSDIYRVRPDGTDLARLTDSPTVDAHPAWSPDGRWISFDSLRDGDREGYVMTMNGCRQQNLTRHPAGDSPLAWSVEGEVLFNSARDGAPEQVFRASIVRDDETGWTLTDIRHLTRGDGPNQAPAWSPDGRRIAFESRRDGHREIYTMDADGANARNLSNNPAADMLPRWSPDGRWIMFVSNRDGDPEIYLMRPDGTEVSQLTRNTGFDHMASFSPDGRWIVFSSDRTGSYRLHVMRPDGGDVRPLIPQPAA